MQAIEQACGGSSQSQPEDGQKKRKSKQPDDEFGEEFVLHNEATSRRTP